LQITEVLSDVDEFPDRFTHMCIDSPAGDKLVVLLYGISFGLAGIADPSHGLGYHNLFNMVQGHYQGRGEQRVAARGVPSPQGRASLKSLSV